MKVRLVQSLGSRHKGGAQRFFLRLAAAMEESGVQHGVIVKRGGWSAAQLKEKPIKTHILPFGGALDVITPVLYPRILHNARANIVLTQLERATKRTPKGPWIHVARLGGYYELKDYRRCHHLVGNTPGCLDHFRKGGWPDDRIHYIPNFVPESETDAKPVRRADFDTPENAPLILWLGRMEHEKGPDMVVRALQHVPGAYLWLAGAGGYEEELRAIAGQLSAADRIRFLGWRNDIHALLKTADLFVCASRFEVLGNIILEAWTHRLPVVAVRSPGPEHLIDHGVTGLLVPNEAPEAMAEAFNRLIEDPAAAKRLGEAGWRQVQSVYSERAVVNQYHRLFEELVSRKAADYPRGPALHTH